MTAVPLKVTAPGPATPDSAPATSVTPLRRRAASTDGANHGPSNSPETPPTDPYLTPALQAVARARARTAQIRAAKERIDAQAAERRPSLRARRDATRPAVPAEPTSIETEVAQPDASTGMSVALAARASKVRFTPRHAPSTGVPYWREYRPSGLVAALSITASQPGLPRHAGAVASAGGGSADASSPAERSLESTSQRSRGGPTDARSLPSETPAAPGRGPFGRHVPLPVQPPAARAIDRETVTNAAELAVPSYEAEDRPVPSDDYEARSELVLSEIADPEPQEQPMIAETPAEAESSPLQDASPPSTPPSPAAPRRFSRTMAAVEERRAAFGGAEEPWNLVPRQASEDPVADDGQRRWFPWSRKKDEDD